MSSKFQRAKTSEIEEIAANEEKSNTVDLAPGIFLVF
jgi:hypothetical protein